MQFLVNLDLNKNEIQNVVIHKLASAPSSPVEGQVYYDTVAHKLLYRDNSAFRTLIDSSASTVTSVTASSPIASSGGAAPNISLTGIVSAANGGTGVASPTIHGILIAQGASAFVSTVLTAGQILIGTTSSDPAAASITGTANRISVASTSGAIAINLDATQFPNSSAANQVLVSSAANAAAWGTVPVAAGGTGKTSWTANTLLYGNGTSAPVELGPLTNGQLVIGSTGAAPVAATLTGTANRVSVSVGAGTITLNTDATQWPSAIAGDAGKALIASGANAAAYGTLGVAGGGTGAVTLTGLLRGNGTSAITGSATVSLTAEVTGTLPVANGGTGAATLTAHGVLVGAGTSAIVATSAGTSGQVLVSGGASADPAFASSGGDVSGSYGSLTVNTVGGASAANIADAVTKRHTQNTDTGTTQTSFAVDSGGTGFRIKDESGLLAVRNLADSADADVRARDLTVRNLNVTGTQTIIQSNTLSIGDNRINLNEDITAPASNSDGGMTIVRLNTAITITGAANNGSGLIRITAAGHGLATGDAVRIDGVVGTTEANSTVTNPEWTVTVISSSTYDLVGSTFTNAYTSGGTCKQRIDASMYWDESNLVWESRVGADSAQTTYTLGRKKAFTIGDGAATTFDLTHSLNTRDFTASVRQAGSPWAHVIVDVQALDLNTVRVVFAAAPASNSYVVTVIG